MGPQPTTTAVFPMRSRGNVFATSGDQVCARCAAMSEGKWRAMASSPAMAVCATMGAFAPDPLVIVTPRAFS